jgi:hypothetical protein
MAARPKALDIIPRYPARRESGTILVIKIPPENIPAAPRPAMAQPTVKAIEFGSCSANQRTGLEKTNGCQIHNLDWIQSIEFSIKS